METSRESIKGSKAKQITITKEIIAQSKRLTGSWQQELVGTW